MATLRDIAKLAGVSVASVSLYMNGKAEGRVSPEKQEVIAAAMKELKYQASPSIAFLNKETNADREYVIGVFWSSDSRSALLGKVIRGIQQGFAKLNTAQCYILVRPFKQDELYKERSLLEKGAYDCVIIANTSDLDMRYLESIEPPMPVVLYNRSSLRYHSVVLNNEELGASVAKQLKKKNYDSVSIFRSMSPAPAAFYRLSGFINECRRLGIRIPNEAQMLEHPTPEGGAEAAKNYLALKDRPSCIYCNDDNFAIGALPVLLRAGLRIPEDVSLISLCLYNTDVAASLIPSLSVAEIPLSKMAEECANTAMYVLTNNITEPQHIVLPTPQIIFRESF